MNKNDFPISVFHPEIKRTILEMNEYYTHNINASCSLMLTAIAYSLNNNYEVEPIKNRIIRPNLWTMFISPSGAGKTPLFDCILTPIKAKQNELHKQYKEQLLQFMQYTEEVKKGSLKDADSNRINEWLLNNFNCINTPEEPQKLTLTIGKYTSEGMNRVLSDNYNNGKAVLLISDEILSILKSFNQYSKGSDEEDFLKYYNYGGEPIIRADSTKELYITEKNVSVMGCTQSDTIYNVITPERISNGNAFRWLYCVEDELDLNRNAFESMLKEQPENDIMQSYNEMIEHFLINYSFKIRRTKLKLSNECIQFAANWLNKVKKNDNIEKKTLLNITAKMEDYLIKFAITLNRSRTYLDNSINKTNIDNETIEMIDMINAEKVMSYFLDNSIEIINRVSNPTDKIFKSDIEKEIYSNLPDVFQYSNFIGEYKRNNISIKTGQRRLNEFQNSKIVGKNKMGEYYKILAA
ncbi:MAG: DUF3987 domain-containing protein [Prolixibacteraceae bacterium]|nr:DUF3987 domain-containing protein [Prolixibacteraceae bacterium]